MPSFPHLHDEVGNSCWLRWPPISGGVYQQTLWAVHLNHVRRTSRRALTHRVKRHPSPEPAVENLPDRVLFDVIDQHAMMIKPLIAAQHIQNHPRSLVLVFQMRSMDQNLLTVGRGQVEVLQENRCFVFCVFVEPNLADAEHAGQIEKLRDHLDHLTRQLNILRFLGIDAQPSEMLHA